MENELGQDLPTWVTKVTKHYTWKILVEFVFYLDFGLKSYKNKNVNSIDKILKLGSWNKTKTVTTPKTLSAQGWVQEYQ